MADAAGGRQEIWVEKYRPERLEDVVGHPDITERLQSYVDRDDLPHLLFAGPAGTGKCLTGETPVLTSDGVERVENVVGDIDGFDAPRPDLEVATFTEDGDFEYASPSDVFSRQADETVTVSTRDGGEFTVTPEHPLLTVDGEGLSWTPAEELADGDRIARPLHAPTPEGDAETDWFEAMDGDRTLVHLDDAFAASSGIPAEENYVGAKKRVVRALRNHGSVDAASDALDVPRNTVVAYADEVADRDLAASSTVCSLAYLRDRFDYDDVAAHVERIQFVSTNNQRSAPITPPEQVSPGLARFLGLVVSEGRIDGGRLRFYNEDERLLEHVETTLEDEFGLSCERRERKGVPFVHAISATLSAYLEACFDVTGDGIVSTLLEASDETRSAFLRAVFDAEGYVTKKGGIELSQKDGEFVSALTYLLAGFGIPARRKREQKAATNGTGIEREYHTLYVSGARDLARFESAVGFTIEEKASRLADAAARDSNPNHDTMPVQVSVDRLCRRLNLQKETLVGELCSDARAREQYLTALDDVLDAADDRLDAAQTALDSLEATQSELAAVTGAATAWVENRPQLEPLDERKAIAETVGARPDRLLEYADGRRTPTGRRVGRLLAELGESGPNVGAVQETLEGVRESLGVSYEGLADGTEYRGVAVNNLLTNDDHSLRSLTRFETVAAELERAAEQMLSLDVAAQMRSLELLASADLYYDEVEAVERNSEPTRVYDLTVPGTHNFVAGNVPTTMHNTASAVSIAKEIYGDDWQDNFLELNASDERGIDVVRDRIKDFARSSFGGHDYRVIFLDEADALCVPPGTEVVTGYPSSPEVKPIEEVAAEGEPMPSIDFETNEIQSDKGKLVDSGVADFFEVELDDGREILASATHPFFVVGEDDELVERELRELQAGDQIADFRDDIGVSCCGVCGDWTTGRFCSIECKNEGHSREMEGDGNPMYGTEWSEERRKKIVEKLSDGRFAGENNPNYGGEFHGVSIWEMDEESVEEFVEALSEQRSGTSWEEWVVEADAEAVKEQIGEASSQWWSELDEEKRAEINEKRVENTDYPVCDITGDDNPMRDPEVAEKVSEALTGHEPTGPKVEYVDELGHYVRSQWEYEVATALDDAGVEYEYEPAFELSESVYYPDFLVDDTVIEVKGVAELWGRVGKVEAFMERYGDEYEFVVVGDSDLPNDKHFDKDEFEPQAVSDGGRVPVSTARIRSIEYSHRGKAYNVSMDGTPNFMLGNGILTHNTDDAQSALRRTMEQFSDNTRFILSCNYSSKIIDPIQSRCAVFRFAQLGDDAVADHLRDIAEAEGLEYTSDGIDALVYAADGDMRRAINALQAASATGESVDEETVYAITATARPEEIEGMVTEALDGDFTAARATLDDLLTNRGLAGGDIIDQIHRSVWSFDVEEAAAVRLLDRLGEADYRIAEGANERVQLEALLASVALNAEESP